MSDTPSTPSSAASAFIARWHGTGGSEMGSAQMFAEELCDLLGVERPLPIKEDGSADHYCFERPIHRTDGSGRRIDLYRKGCFVWEAKQGVEGEGQTTRLGHGKRGTSTFARVLMEAKGQADGYARAAAKEDGWPPFLLVVDVGKTLQVWADFSLAGHGYTHFPDRSSFEISLDDLARPEIQERLKAIWLDPLSLDPAKQSAKVTREIADLLADLGRSLEAKGHESETVARFLMRCLFTMFAEDVGLIPREGFTTLLEGHVDDPRWASADMEALWAIMDRGGPSKELRADLRRFNGNLFKDCTALEVDATQLDLLIKAAKLDWTAVEPSIFGTLLERALDKKARHKLGAHYTPREYVERLVTPTIMEPLREDWKNAKSSAHTLLEAGKPIEAGAELRRFHDRLCNTRVLDPACGSGNFLYVAMEMMKRLEAEVLERMFNAGETTPSFTVNPSQFLGIELNPWAAQVAELVLWIGYLRWQIKDNGLKSINEPIIHAYDNIENRDAVLVWDERVPRLDPATGEAVTIWDGETTKTHPVTGEEVPDADARIPVYDYINPRAAAWPAADFIVGNPPFIGNKRMRETLGDGYVDALWRAYPGMPRSVDLVMFWWEKAAKSLKAAAPAKSFGLITTNSIRQKFNRRILETHIHDDKRPVTLSFAIPDHPWVDTQFGAAVRVAMTVGVSKVVRGRLISINEEKRILNEDSDARFVVFDEQLGAINPTLSIGADVAGSLSLKANSELSHQGVIPVGEGFRVDKATALARYRDEIAARLLKRYINGRQFLSGADPDYIIDFFGYSEKEARARFPSLFQQVYDRVKPHRNQVKRKAHREKWFIFAEPRSKMRPAIFSMSRFIVTCRTARHRVFGFLDASVLPDAKLIAIGLSEANSIAVLSSKFQEVWALASGAYLGVGNDATYNHSESFNKFPFPDLNDKPALKAKLDQLGEDLDAHRKRQQGLFPKLTLTQMYNVLEKVRAEAVLTDKERVIYDQGLIGILRQLHDDIDAAVAEAYGWPADLSDEEILFNLVALNRERAREEEAGLVRWLRPDYQNPSGKGATVSAELDLAKTEAEITVPAASQILWPKSMPERFEALRTALADAEEATPARLAKGFKGGGETTIRPMLESLVALGYARRSEDGKRFRV